MKMKLCILSVALLVGQSMASTTATASMTVSSSSLEERRNSSALAADQSPGWEITSNNRTRPGSISGTLKLSNLTEGTSANQSEKSSTDEVDGRNQTTSGNPRLNFTVSNETAPTLSSPSSSTPTEGESLPVVDPWLQGWIDSNSTAEYSLEDVREFEDLFDFHIFAITSPMIFRFFIGYISGLIAYDVTWEWN
mmetsp:Transcript_27830/g.42094  ORF Transcript_27830/g.42094 Transcript_27830/m.42094 type:complete len:194 (-) Transcript_27830:396-977(-)